MHTGCLGAADTDQSGVRRRPVLLSPPWRQQGSIRKAAFQKGCGPCASHADSGGAELPRGEAASFLSGSAAGFPRRGAGTLLCLWSPRSAVTGHQSHAPPQGRLGRRACSEVSTRQVAVPGREDRGRRRKHGTVLVAWGPLRATSSPTGTPSPPWPYSRRARLPG